MSQFMFTLNYGTMYWKRSKKSIIVDSMIEAEYMGLNDIADELKLALIYIVVVF